MKTLRNFYLSNDPLFDDSGDSLTEENLKKAAIEWINESKKILIYCIPKHKTELAVRFSDNPHELADSIFPLEREEIRLQETIKWIKHFFNLTDDDVNVLNSETKQTGGETNGI